jgi:dinuclear metal center YbgI/SA1388 family protein
MANRNDIIIYTNDYLNIADFKDYGPQGLQVEGKTEVRKIITAVSASVELFQKANSAAADMIIVHHGLLWDRESSVVKGGFKQRLLTLLSNDISLLAYHLPLDAHPEIGNNALAATALGLDNIKPLGDVGVMGTIAVHSFSTLLSRIKSLYQSQPLVFAYGPENVQRIGICSGGAERDITIAIEQGLHVYITGEAGEATMHLAKEGNIHFIAAGHYATERLGIRALGEHLARKFDLEVEFIDIPNPV